MREGNKVGINCQKHHFYRHQQDDEIFAIKKDAYHADGKQQGTQYQIMRQC
jgi:hypothetical protein